MNKENFEKKLHKCVSQTHPFDDDLILMPLKVVFDSAVQN